MYIHFYFSNILLFCQEFKPIGKNFLEENIKAFYPLEHLSETRERGNESDIGRERGTKQMGMDCRGVRERERDGGISVMHVCPKNSIQIVQRRIARWI